MEWVAVILLAWETTNDYFVYYSSQLNPTLTTSTKVVLCLFFLIFIRAGLPRYRYDYLTKLGWSQFLLLMLVVLVSVYLLITLWS